MDSQPIDLIDQMRRLFSAYQTGGVDVTTLVDKASGYQQALLSRGIAIAEKNSVDLWELSSWNEYIRNRGVDDLSTSSINDIVKTVLHRLEGHGPVWSNTPELR